MNTNAMHLGVTLRFLDSEYHGRRDKNAPEWPPSPLRVFQALVAAAGSRGRSKGSFGAAEPALRWLETLPPPTVIAPRAEVGMPFRVAVPNNDLDVIASAWARGVEPKKQSNELKTMKSIRPIRLREDDAVHYLWPLPFSSGGASHDHLAALKQIARSVVALGWGVDLVVGDAGLVNGSSVDQLLGERWTPGPEGPSEDGLRVPVPGTLDALSDRERAFLSRLDIGGFYRSPPPLSVFGVRPYRPATSVTARPLAAFSILRLDASGFRPFDCARRGLTVAGMVRRATRLAAEGAGWSQDRVNGLILGHGEKLGAEHVPIGPRRFAFLPVPSVEWRGAGETISAIRRILVTSLSGDLEAEVDWVRRSLSGQALLDERSGEAIALLSLIPSKERALRRYLDPSSSWATVSPVVLPGFDDPDHYRRRIRKGVSAQEQRDLLRKLDERIDGLLRKAIIHSGFSEELARHAEIEWRGSGFFPGVDLAAKYGVPGHLARFPRFHVRLRWRDSRGGDVKVTGPVCIGGGRYYGVGLCAAE